MSLDKFDLWFEGVIRRAFLAGEQWAIKRDEHTKRNALDAERQIEKIKKLTIEWLALRGKANVPR